MSKDRLECAERVRIQRSQEEGSASTATLCSNQLCPAPVDLGVCLEVVVQGGGQEAVNIQTAPCQCEEEESGQRHCPAATNGILPPTLRPIGAAAMLPNRLTRGLPHGVNGHPKYPRLGAIENPTLHVMAPKVATSC